MFWVALSMFFRLSVNYSAFPPIDVDLRPRPIFQLFHDEVLTQLTLELRLLGPRADRLPGVAISCWNIATFLASSSFV